MAIVKITLMDVPTPTGTRISLHTEWDPPPPEDGEPDRAMTTAEIVAHQMLQVLADGASKVGELEAN